MYKVKKYLSDIVLIISFLAIGCLCLALTQSSEAIYNTSHSSENLTVTYPSKYGFDIGQHNFEAFRIKPNAFLGDILMNEGIDFDRILELERKAEDVFSLRKIMAGKDIIFVKDDPCEAPVSFIYEPNKLSYVRYDLTEDVDVCRINKDFEVCIASASGVVKTSLWDAMIEEGLNVGLIDKMEDALSQVYFHAAQEGDQFKLVYEQILIDGKTIGTGNIYSAAYQSGSIVDYGFYFESEKYKGYYDFSGTPNKKTFLKAPVKFSRISSGYNPNRFHPVLKRRKAHLGTDYAARRGTPIMAVADGIITKRSYTKGNGNYVKIKHDNVYDTQYLHMSRFAKGLRPGSRVRQGQTIGYVGSTGLATGPHVCFRFWKNGRQINHLRENFPPLDPMEDEDLPAFFSQRDILLEELAEVPFKTQDVLLAGYSD